MGGKDGEAGPTQNPRGARPTRSNRDACVGIAVFGSAEVAPVKVPFAQYGDKAILVLDKEHPDPGPVSLAYLWSRWVAKRNLADNAASLDFGKIEALIVELTRSSST